MENLLFKELVKKTIMFISPFVIISLVFFHGQLKIGLAVVVGAVLGLLRLKAFFNYIICTLDQERSNKTTITIIKYLGNWLLTLGAIGFVLSKSVTIGLAMLFGLIAVCIAVTVYAMLKGISFYRKK